MDDDTLREFDLLNDATRFHADRVRNVRRQVLERPVANLFRRMTFDEYSQTLEDSLRSLADIEERIWGPLQLLRVGSSLRQFVILLREYAITLHGVTNGLEQQSQGLAYSKSEFKADCKKLIELSEVLEAARREHNATLADYFDHRSGSKG